MNTIKNFAILILSLFILVGCSDDFLEEKKLYNNFNYGIFQNEPQTDEYLAFIYYEFYNGYNKPTEVLLGSFSDDKTGMTEEKGGSIDDFIDFTVFLETSEDASDYYGGKLKEGSGQNHPYTRIRDCNNIIESIQKYGEGHLKEEFINGAIGQALYLRAIQYFDLMRTYGGVPLVTEVQNASAQNPDIQLPRASVAEMVEQITKDLDEAAKLLPMEWDGANFGRPTAAAALAMKSRVLLTAASPLFNTDWDNPGSQLWQDALAAGLEAEDELELNGYGLYGSNASDWSKIFYNFNNKFVSEAINVILCSGSTVTTVLANQWESSIRLPSQGGNGIPAPKEMIDLFPMADGSRPTAANGYDEFLFFKDRDPRFYRTFAFSGYRWKSRDTPANPLASTVWAYHWNEVSESGDTTSHFSEDNDLNSPAFVCKMSHLAIDSALLETSNADIFEYRYAELLLNIAECYAATNKISECIDYLGKIRARVGIPSANNYGIGTLADKYAAIEACLYERRVELAYEGKRFWDIQRWMLYNDDASANNTTCAKLGVPTINGTARTGHYLHVKDSVTEADPLISVRKLSFDPDDANSADQLVALEAFYTDYFELMDLPDPMDQKDGVPATIDWKQHYYINGLNTEVLTVNPWLKQTAGWTDIFGGPGTFEYR